MKKVSIVMLSVFLVFCLFGVRTYADSVADLYGFNLDDGPYDIAMASRFEELWGQTNYGGTQVLGGLHIIKTAVYENSLDDDLALLIIQSQVEPYDYTLPTGLFGMAESYNAETSSQRIYSDIDDSTLTFAQSAYISTYGFQMEQPSPMAEPEDQSYEVELQLSQSAMLSGVVSFDMHELDYDYNHSAFNDIFDFTYLYSTNFLDRSYMNDLTYNKGACIVDMTDRINSPSGKFANETTLTTTFQVTRNVLFGGDMIYPITNLTTVTIYY